MNGQRQKTENIVGCLNRVDEGKKDGRREKLKAEEKSSYKQIYILTQGWEIGR